MGIPIIFYYLIIATLLTWCLVLMRKNRKLQQIYEARSRALATRDFLTNLYNRQFFETFYQAEIDRAFAARQKNSADAYNFAVAILNIANFRDLNIFFGRNDSDKILKKIADQLKGRIKNEQVISRYDGAEFALLFTNVTDANFITTMLKNLVTYLESLNIATDNEEEAYYLKVYEGLAFFKDHYIIGDDFSVIRFAEKQIADRHSKSSMERTNGTSS